MSRLTESQREYLLEAQSALERRELIVLKGGGQGKTRIHYELQENVADYDNRAGIIRTTRRHPENSQIDFLQLVWPRTDKISEATLMRQVVAKVMNDQKAYQKISNDNLKVRAEFMEILKQYRTDNRVLAIAADNAELMPSRGFVVLKWANELRDVEKRRSIGLAAVVAGQWGGMKAPAAFWSHCTEIRVGKIKITEIADVIREYYPAELSAFKPDALRVLAEVDTTLGMHDAIRKAVFKRKTERATVIDAALITSVLPVSKAA